MLQRSTSRRATVLTVHHACMHTLGGTQAVKLIENQMGIAVIDTVQFVAAVAGN